MIEHTKPHSKHPKKRVFDQGESLNRKGVFISGVSFANSNLKNFKNVKWYHCIYILFNIHIYFIEFILLCC